MSLDISNPCGNMFLAVAGFKDNLRTSPPRNATLVQSFINLCRFGALFVGIADIESFLLFKASAVAGFKDNLRTSPPQNATLVQSFQTFARFKALFADKSAQKCNFGLKLVKVRGYSLFCDEWFSLQIF